MIILSIDIILALDLGGVCQSWLRNCDYGWLGDRRGDDADGGYGEDEDDFECETHRDRDSGSVLWWQKLLVCRKEGGAKDCRIL